MTLSSRVIRLEVSEQTWQRLDLSGGCYGVRLGKFARTPHLRIIRPKRESVSTGGSSTRPRLEECWTSQNPTPCKNPRLRHRLSPSEAMLACGDVDNSAERTEVS